MLMKRNDLILIPTFLNFSCLKKNSWDYHPMFIALVIHNFGYRDDVMMMENQALH
jgi:hypothetical protein